MRNVELLGKTGWMPWRNDGSTEIGPYEIFQKNDVELVDGECVTLGERPTASGKHYAVNGPMAVAPGGYGDYHPGPEVFVACDAAPEPGELWKPKAGESKATKGSGAWALRIIGVWQAEYNNAKAVIETAAHALIGKLDEALEAGGSATMSIWTGEPGSESDSGEDEEVYDWLEKAGGSGISSGKKVIAISINGYSYVLGAECE